MNTLGSLVDNDDNRYKQYQNADHIDRKAINALEDKDLYLVILYKITVKQLYATLCQR